MRFEVPQFIEVEDKIVGPLTWKQFIYLAGGAGILIILYFIAPFIIFAMIGLPLGALAASLAFHRVNNRPFSIFLESFVNYVSKGKLYLWQKSEQQSVIDYSEPRRDEIAKIVPTDGNRLASLAEKLDYYAQERDR